MMPRFQLISAIYQGKASKEARFGGRWDFCMSLIFDLEMTQLFGGVDKLDAADELDVQRMWLAFQARLDAQNELQKDAAPKS
jgi:hypothetical protein